MWGCVRRAEGERLKDFCFVLFFWWGVLSLIRSSEDLRLVSVSWTSFVEKTSDHFR